MNNDAIREVVLTYIAGWKESNRDKILECFDPECVVIESYGPTYRGLEMVSRWITSWFAPGNEVNQWDVTSLYTADETCFFEWIFECTYMGERAGFEGASIACLKNGKIVYLREYAMTAPRYEWPG